MYIHILKNPQNYISARYKQQNKPGKIEFPEEQRVLLKKKKIRYEYNNHEINFQLQI